jgi:hypothetical protein
LPDADRVADNDHDVKALLTATVLLLAVAGSTAIAQRVVPMKGTPAISCGAYAEVRINEGALGVNSIQMFSWVQGYLSGYNNYAKHPVVSVPEIAAIGVFLDKYCSDNPVHRVINGIDALLAELGGYKQPYLGK